MTSADTIATYIAAKDCNRPLLMARAFATHARLTMHVKSDAVSFPGAVEGREAISHVLVSDFATKYENVYTFCLARPAAEDRATFTCPWLVGMCTKADGSLRVGCGSYDWRFDHDGLVEDLTIRIERMEVLPPATQVEIMGWLTALDYPWCDIGAMLAKMPGLDGLAPIRSYLEASGRAA